MSELQRLAVTTVAARSVLAIAAGMLVALAGLEPDGAAAATFTVTRTDDQLDSAPGDGQCVALNGGGCSLRAAVQEANALFGADGIYLPPGTYLLSLAGAGEDLAASGDLDIASAITLLGAGWAVTSIEMQAFGDRIFDIQGFSSLELGDVTLSGGFVAGVGGGVYVRTGGGLAIRRSRIQGCAAHHGGAIGTLGGSVTVEGAELAHDYAFANPPTWFARGPAIAGDEQATVTVRRSSVHDNQYSDSGSAGGIDVWSSELSIESSSVVDDGAPTTSINGTNSDLTIVSSTIGRMTVDGSAPPGASLSLGCSVVGYCTLTGGNVTYSSNGMNVFFDGTACVGVNDVDGDWSLYPLWAPPEKFPARLPNSYSAALEAGHPFVCAAADQWSQALRPFDSDGDGTPVLEIGAVEVILVIFRDGFEIGSTAFWSSTVP